MTFKTAPLALAVSFAVLATNTLAQDFALEEIVVTATKRAASLQEVPVTVTAFSAATIEDAGLNDAVDVAAITPSLTIVTPLGPFSSRMNIRGIGTSASDPANDPSVGVFVDGIYQSAVGIGLSDLVDIERIEVLQGPQGTLYGKNTNAGAISIITKQPSSDATEGSIEAQTGERNLQKLSASISGPVSDTLSYRLSGSSNKQDGYLKSTGAAEDLNSKDDWNLTGKLAYQASENLHLLVSASHVDRDSTGYGADATISDITNSLLVMNGHAADKNDPLDYQTGNSTQHSFKLKSDAVSLTADYDLDNGGSIKWISAYDEYETSNVSDPDHTQLDVISLADKRSAENFSQEIRFTSNSEAQVEYQAGLYYFDGTINRGPLNTGTLGDDMRMVAGANVSPTIGLVAAPGDEVSVDHQWDTTTIAAFSQVTWHATDSIDITGGLRWSDEDKKVKLDSRVISTAPIMGDFLPTGMAPPNHIMPNPVPAHLRHYQTLMASIFTPLQADWKRNSKNVDWMLRASFNINEDVMLFASAGTGTKSGGFNGVNGLTREEREFDDESTTNFELGIKSTNLDGRLRTNATAFFTEITEYQQTFQLPSGAGSSTINEGKVNVSGVDLNVQAAVLANLTLEFGLMYFNEAEITEGANKGDKLFLVPELQGNVAANFVFPLGDGMLYSRVDYSAMGEHNTGGGNFQNRELLNAKFGWRNDNWNLSVWGKNLRAITPTLNSPLRHCS